MPDQSISQRRRQWGKALLILSSVLVTWGAGLILTGGFLVEIGPLRVSSRNASRVFLLATGVAVVAWRLAYRDWLGRVIRSLIQGAAELEHWFQAHASAIERLAAPLAWTLGAAVMACGIGYGSRVAGGADAYGYVSASVLWRNGTLGIDQDYAASLPWPGAIGSFVPLAYRLGANGVMGPTVAPGLPLLMSFATLFSSCGPYLIVPLCAVILIAATFQLGRQLFGSATALVASILVACSPVVVFESLVVMADVPAAAMWMGALAFASRATSAGALAAGLLSGVAILVRPNLLPLALFPWLLSLVRSTSRGSIAARTGLFAAGSVPAALFIAWINHRVYGSALSSGYGDLGGAFALAHASTNLRLYAGWWLESQGALAFLFVVSAFRRRRMAREYLVLAGYAVATALLYLFYLPFDQWWYLRFLLPAIPIAFLLCADVIEWVTHRRPALRVVATTAFVAAVAVHAIRFIDSKDLFANSESEQRRYLDPAASIDRLVPREAVILSMQHSGSIRYYTGRLTMRWDVLDPAWLDRAVAALQSRGVPAYAAIESWEESDFRARFAGQLTLDRLNEGAIAVSEDGELRLYPLTDAHRSGTPLVIPSVSGRQCVEGSPQFVYPEATRLLRSGR